MFLILLIFFPPAFSETCKMRSIEGVDKIDFLSPHTFIQNDCPCNGNNCTIDLTPLACGIELYNITTNSLMFISPINPACSQLPIFRFILSSNIYTMNVGYIRITTESDSFVSIGDLVISQPEGAVQFFDINETVIIKKVKSVNESTLSSLSVINSKLNFISIDRKVTLNLINSDIHFTDLITVLNQELFLRQSIIYISKSLLIESAHFTIYYDQYQSWSVLYANSAIEISSMAVTLVVEGDSLSSQSDCYQESCAPFISNTPGNKIYLSDNITFEVLNDTGMDKLEILLQDHSVELCFTRTQGCSVVEKYGYIFVFILFFILLLPFLVIPVVIWMNKMGCRKKDPYQDFGY
ncbi:hypothetical protein EDI_335020 [Entamoeba dispar SAW760]|uniref:Uncharacterized protein n=1 Tax=Entamoeba dispar (strain ATCC PRA-260 / SAW760) TaxID=370354 RepID=B0ESY3_ENTDS|nr:uncharacterized protein EDI_335020 [Entamoeba dispar SAW760]EDR22346.1 hypothetical protein EDI_335020 [Entamoeba dispar SAW760]|eukprot:EDR22346.1 hypothetical protein EDI_335020 [Entamoeba dispar SAW760]